MLAPNVALGFAALAAMLHLGFFILESVLWGRPKLNRRFGLRDEEAQASALFAKNQGFYNLFLAIGVGVGIALQLSRGGGLVLVWFGCAVMLGAGVVLAATAPQLRRAAIIQAGPPFLALLLSLPLTR